MSERGLPADAEMLAMTVAAGALRTGLAGKGGAAGGALLPGGGGGTGGTFGGPTFDSVSITARAKCLCQVAARIAQPDCCLIGYEAARGVL